MYESTHFTLLSAIDADFLHDLALELELIDALVRGSAAAGPPARQARNYIILLPNREFERFSKNKQHVAAFFAAGDKNFLLSRASVRQDIDHYVRREYAKLAIESLANPALPLWFSVGYSEYLAGIRIDGDIFEFAIVNRALYDYLGLNAWLAMGRVVDSAAMAQHDGREWHLAAGQSWMLVHYLVHNEKTRQSLFQWLDAYSELRASGMDEIASFTRMVGAGPTGFRKDLLAYFSSCCKNYALPLERILPDFAARLSTPERAQVAAIIDGVTEAAERSANYANLATIAVELSGDIAEQLPALLAAYESNPSQFEHGWALAQAYRAAGNIKNAKLHARNLYTLLSLDDAALADIVALERSLEIKPDVP